ncbi:hypothetical protein F2P56_012600 [Juglans regia]|uniref:Protein IWS1 homolog n=2 Tax=Juglans regia TaxID=51240 RepID=A0A2I4F4S3_JUGRE|nr:protein IWS1 homolog [Juglans regia]KAF5468450.1 hypothetical protein F2P56_012600 [Juglans regia]
MESDDDFQLLSPTEETSPAVRNRKLKRLKKAITDPGDPPLNQSQVGTTSSYRVDLSKFEAPDLGESDGQDLNEPSRSRTGLEGFDGGERLDPGGLGDEEDGPVAKRALEGTPSPLVDFSGSEAPAFDGSNEPELNEPSRHRVGLEGFNDGDGLNTGRYDGFGGDEDGSGVKRALEFDTVADDFDENVEYRSAEMVEDTGDLSLEKPKKKRRSTLETEGKKESNKRRKSVETATAKRMTQKERKDHLKQLRAESQRLLRETRDVSFKPVPLVQKPISSVLEKIRKRKMEVSKKYAAINRTSFINENEDDYAREVVVDCISGGPIDDERGNDRFTNVPSEEEIELPANMKSNLDVSNMDASNENMDESNILKDCSSHESRPSQMGLDDNSNQAFRIPIDDTQELFSNFLTSDSKDELSSETPNSPMEVLAPSILAMNLKLDSAPPDSVSDEEEDNDKENIDPHPHGLTDLSLSPHGDPVKGFIDDEAEEEDDSDNDLLHFQEIEEDEGNDEDYEELNDMIATECEEKTIDNEKRNQLHQTWLEQQDAAGTENLLQKLKCGSKLKETSLLEAEEDEEGEGEMEDFGDEVAEDVLPTDVARINLRKVKQMIPQMFTEKDDVYLSSDDEDMEMRLSKRRLFEKSAAQAKLLSPAEDESSREVFGRIKKLNIVPETKKIETPAFSNKPHIGEKNISSKSSFLGRASTHTLSSSQKHGSSTVRSFIFGRDDSNSRGASSISEDSSDMIQTENRPTRPASAKFSNSQVKTSTQNTKSVAEMKPATSLFEILRRSSSLQSEHCTRENMVVQTETVFAAFKLAKKPMKTEGKA